MSRPGVYAFMQGEQFLYIGSTKDLAKRPNKRDRGHVSRFTAILQATHTDFFPCKSLTEAQQLEEQMVRTHKPQHNQRNPLGPADMEKTWQIIKDNW